MEDVFPLISMSRDIGELVDDITIDYPALVAHMRASDFSDTEITETAIEIRSDVISREYTNEPGKVYTTYGSYLKRNGKGIISLFPVDALHDARRHKSDGTTFLDKEPEQGLSDYFSETLVHELEHHAIRTVEGGMKREQLAYALGRLGIKAATAGVRVSAVAAIAYRTIEQFIPSVAVDRPEVHVGMVAMALATSIKAADKTREQYDYYYAKPEEIRCRAAEQYAPGGLVQFRLKTTSA